MICFILKVITTGLKGKRIDNSNTHGTGCTLSSAIASNLAKGYDLEISVERAKAYIRCSCSNAEFGEREVVPWIMDLTYIVNLQRRQKHHDRTFIKSYRKYLETVL